MILPERVIPVYLRVTRANSAFVSEQGADAAVEHQRLFPASHVPPARLGSRHGIAVEVDRGRGVPVYTVSPADPTAAVIYLHGGGWVHELRSPHWDLIEQIAVEANVAVIVPIYTLLPFGTAAEANDLVVGLHDELRRRYDPVHLAGDSAGGQIALSAALSLRERGVDGIRSVLVSPALDLTLSNPRIPGTARKDPWLGIEGLRALGARWAADLPAEDPRVSPLYGAPAGLGPVLLFTGTHDVLNPDTHLFADKARAVGVEVDLVEREGAVHVFPLLPTRAGRNARRRIVAALTT